MNEDTVVSIEKDKKIVAINVTKQKRRGVPDIEIVRQIFLLVKLA